MIEAIHATPKNLKELLPGVTKDDKILKYKIPSYQRPYSWTEEQCGQLWEDILNFYEQTKDDKNTAPYFLGNIVCYPTKENKNSEVIDLLEVIDGQQRLTSIFLLLRALHAKAVNYVPLYSLFWVTTLDIDSNPKTEHELRLTTDVLGDKESRSFESVMSHNQQSTDENTKHFKNFKFFEKKVEEFYSNNPSEYLLFINTIIGKIVLLPINCNSQEQALTVFETINNRGMNLTDSDIFKANLYKAAQKNKSEEEFIESWDALTQNTESAKTHLDDIFRIYLRILRGKEGIKDTEPALRKFFTDSSSKFNLSKQDWKDTLNKLERICQCVQYLTVSAPPKIIKWITILKQGTQKTQSSHVVESPLYAYLFEHLDTDGNPHLKKEHEQEFESLCSGLVRFVYGEKLAGQDLNNIKYIYFQAVIDILETKGISKTLSDFNNKLDRENFNIIETKINDGDFTQKIRNVMVYILGYHENDVKDQGPVEIEHILPKNWKHYQYNWSPEDAKKARDSIGNLVLLEHDLNKAAGNAIFSQKKEEAYKHSKINAAKALSEIEEWTYAEFQEREKKLKGELKMFFRGK